MPNFYDSNENVTVPYGWTCGVDNCNKFAPFSVKEEGKLLGQRQRCISHLPSNVAVYGLRQTASGGVVETPYVMTLGFASSYDEAMSYAVAAVSDFMTQKRNADAALSRFKDNVVETTVEWEGGCREGKEEFLQALGLEWPTTYVTLTVTFNYSGEAGNIDSSEIEYAVERTLDAEVSDMYCEVDY